MDTTLTAVPLLLNSFAAPIARETSDPVAISIRSGVDSESLSTYPPFTMFLICSSFRSW